MSNIEQLIDQLKQIRLEEDRIIESIEILTSTKTRTPKRPAQISNPLKRTEFKEGDRVSITNKITTSGIFTRKSDIASTILVIALVFVLTLSPFWFHYQIMRQFNKLKYGEVAE